MNKLDKKTQVVMLPINQKSQLPKYNILCKNLYVDNELPLVIIPKMLTSLQHRMIPQNLYLVSDEEIKEGDWFGIQLDNLWDIVKCIKVDNKFVYYEKLTVPGVSKIGQPFSIHKNLKPKKVIATTDLSLEIEHPYSNDRGDMDFPLPQPSKKFIQYYIEQYNQGNIIEWVDVEYELIESCLPMPNIHVRNDYYQLKVNQNNTINISPIKKDSWSRDEVVELIKQAVYKKQNAWKIGELDKWISENLK